jgi:hypothetical protein
MNVIKRLNNSLLYCLGLTHTPGHTDTHPRLEGHLVFSAGLANLLIIPPHRAHALHDQELVRRIHGLLDLEQARVVRAPVGDGVVRDEDVGLWGVSA